MKEGRIDRKKKRRKDIYGRNERRNKGQTEGKKEGRMEGILKGKMEVGK